MQEWFARMDGDVCRYGDAADGVLRAHSVIRACKRAQVQRSQRLDEIEVWRAGDDSCYRVAHCEKHNRTAVSLGGDRTHGDEYDRRTEDRRRAAR